MLQHPKILQQEGKKDNGAEKLFKKHHCNKIFLLLWDPPLLIQHQENRSGKKGPVIGPRPGREKESKGKERPISFGEKTENRMSGATVDGEKKGKTFKARQQKNRLQSTVKEGTVWVSDRVPFQTECRLR